MQLIVHNPLNKITNLSGATSSPLIMQSNWTLRENPLLDTSDEDVVLLQPQPARNGIVKVTEMLRQLNKEDTETGLMRPRNRKESESDNDDEDDRTDDLSASRRSSGADSGLGNLSENELLEHETRPGI